MDQGCVSWIYSYQQNTKGANGHRRYLIHMLVSLETQALTRFATLCEGRQAHHVKAGRMCLDISYCVVVVDIEQISSVLGGILLS